MLENLLTWWISSRLKDKKRCLILRERKEHEEKMKKVAEF
jgi:hypothetical protein